MTIDKKRTGTELTLIFKGRLDTNTAPLLEEILQSDLQGVTLLTFDFSGLEYISSAGLRVLLLGQKYMNKQGKMIILGANENIKEVFSITGFSDILEVM